LNFDQDPPPPHAHPLGFEFPKLSPLPPIFRSRRASRFGTVGPPTPLFVCTRARFRVFHFFFFGLTASPFKSSPPGSTVFFFGKVWAPIFPPCSPLKPKFTFVSPYGFSATDVSLNLLLSLLSNPLELPCLQPPPPLPQKIIPTFPFSRPVYCIEQPFFCIFFFLCHFSPFRVPPPFFSLSIYEVAIPAWILPPNLSPPFKNPFHLFSPYRFP